MTKIKNNGLDQYGAEPFQRQQFETVGVEWAKFKTKLLRFKHTSIKSVSTVIRPIGGNAELDYMM